MGLTLNPINITRACRITQGSGTSPNQCKEESHTQTETVSSRINIRLWKIYPTVKLIEL